MGSTDDFISSWVQNDARPLTARLLSRMLEVDLATAKASIAKFYDAHQEEMHATYLLKGVAPAPAPAPPLPLPLASKRPREEDGAEQAELAEKAEPMDVDAPAPGEMTLILIVSEAHREAAQKRFTHLIADEIYSLHPGPHASAQGDAAQLVQAGHDGSHGKALANWEKAGRGGAWGAITNPEINDQLSAGDRQKLAQRAEASAAAGKPQGKPAGTAGSAAPPPSASGRGKRKVIKRQKTKNAKGYTVVQDVEVWESCSESEADPPARSAPPAESAGSGSSSAAAAAAGSDKAPPSKAPAKPAAKKGYSGPPQKTQQSLASFFGKKK